MQSTVSTPLVSKQRSLPLACIKGISKKWKTGPPKERQQQPPKPALTQEARPHQAMSKWQRRPNTTADNQGHSDEVALVSPSSPGGQSPPKNPVCESKGIRTASKVIPSVSVKREGSSKSAPQPKQATTAIQRSKDSTGDEPGDPFDPMCNQDEAASGSAHGL